MSDQRKFRQVKLNSRQLKVKKRKNLAKPLYMTIAIVIIMFLGVSIAYSHLSSIDKEIMAKEKEISDLKKTKLALEAEVKGIKSSAEIQDEAMYKLGMVYPSQEQIVYVDISENKKQLDVNNNVFLSPILSVLKSFTKD
ncbi:Septum formation initiator [Peptoniphilus asaccharolyticus DSM 20463]|uniref:Septum formation initiator n=1 Tax=Peptoniphilus asaccharolyticus DSM 20463 TaxID=573058 RepID=A0A1W1UXQ1_PEPAS|nr:septum formation initiator family protein [Peptoniphilus asaccharolyticus]MBL7575294.1 septum formation initiator family protein [Peptoniphilus asaccharolyticus]SMB85551.1 Septum formation initiator [Peptoniphilus asaccharolyticus DSM 20463]